MKHLLILMFLLSFVVVGCGGGGATGASETKEVAECAAEAESMSEDALKATIANYQTAIAVKTQEARALLVEMAKNGRSEELTDKAAKIDGSLTALRERAEVYFKAGAKKFGNL